jgi:hypothetical protein
LVVFATALIIYFVYAFLQPFNVVRFDNNSVAVCNTGNKQIVASTTATAPALLLTKPNYRSNVLAQPAQHTQTTFQHSCQSKDIFTPQPLQTTNFTTHAVTAVLTHRLYGPELSVLFSIPRLRFIGQVGGSETSLLLKGKLYSQHADETSSAFFYSFENWEILQGQYFYLYKDGPLDYIVRTRLPSTLFDVSPQDQDPIVLIADLQVTLTRSVKTNSSECPQFNMTQQLEFGKVRVDFPLSFDFNRFASLVQSQKKEFTFEPDLAICYGPIFDITKYDQMYFFEYLIESLEYHRRIGVSLMVLYIDFSRVNSRSAKAFLQTYAASGDVIIIDTTILNERVLSSWYHNQFVVINDCMLRVSSIHRFAFVCDVDEWLWPSNGLTIQQSLTHLIDYRQKHDKNTFSFIFEQADDHRLMSEVCFQHHPNQSLADASITRETALMHGNQLKLSFYPFFETNMTWHHKRARAKGLHFTALTEFTRNHGAWGIGTQSRASIPAITGLYKLHLRDVNLHIERCKVWHHDWLQSQQEYKNSKEVLNFFSDGSYHNLMYTQVRGVMAVFVRNLYGE